jgi:hypothetical protein
MDTSKMSALQTFMLMVDRDKQAAIAIAEQTAQGNLNAIHANEKG